MMPHLLLAAALAGSPASSLINGCYGAHGGYYGMPAGYQVQHADAHVKGGELIVKQFVVVMVPYTETFKKVVIGKDGKSVEIQFTKTAFKSVSRVVEQKVLLEKVQAFDSDGNKIAAKTWPDLLAKSTPVLIGFGAEVNSNYFRILKKGTLVLVLPRPEPHYASREEISPPASFEVNFVQDDNPFIPPAPKKTNGPNGPKPNIAGASIDDQGTLHLQQTGNNKFDQEFTKKEKYKDGDDWKEREVKIKIKNTMFTVTKQSLPAKFVMAHGVDGKAIDAKSLTNLLKKHTTVLVSADGKEVDPYYLQIFKEGTVVLQIPRPNYGNGPVPIGVAPKSDDDDLLPPPPLEKKKLPAPPVKAEAASPPKGDDDAPAPKAGQLPQGAPPVFAYVMEIGPRELICARTNTKPVWQERTKTITVKSEDQQVVEKYAV